MYILTYIFIFLTGVITTITDISKKKIFNKFILIIISLGTINYFWALLSKQISLSIHLAINILIGFFIGLLLYYLKIWRGGDAKLFITYCLLIPMSKTDCPLNPLSYPSLLLFINTFLSATLIILLFLLKDIITTNKIKSNKTFLAGLAKDALRYLIKITLITLGVTWFIFPLVTKYLSQNNIILIIIIIYATYYIMNYIFKKVSNFLKIILIAVIGLFLRAVFFPQSLAFANIVSYIKQVFLYSSIIFLLQKTIFLNKSLKEAIPFAPFLFIGAILANTNFLIKTVTILNNLKRWN